MILPIGKARQVFIAIIGDQQNVMFAVAPRARLIIGERQHRLHRHDHAGGQNGVDILAQLKPRLAAIVMAEHPKGMAIAKGSLLQQIPLGKEGIDLFRDLRTRRPRFQQGNAQFMRGDIGFPDPQRCGINLADKQGPLQGSVIP